LSHATKNVLPIMMVVIREGFMTFSVDAFAMTNDTNATAKSRLHP
jgi:hypothetical protein